MTGQRWRRETASGPGSKLGHSGRRGVAGHSLGGSQDKANVQYSSDKVKGLVMISCDFKQSCL